MHIFTANVKDLLDENNINCAIKHLRTKQNSCGSDNQLLYDLPQYWEGNKALLSRKINAGSYIPGIAREKEIVSGRGKRRKIYLINSIDRLFSRALLQVLQRDEDKILHNNCLAYRQEAGLKLAVQKSRDYVEEGYRFTAEIDINDYFDSINHNLFWTKLSSLFQDEKIFKLLWSLITCSIERDFQIISKRKGVITGNSLSPIVGNIFLRDFDYNLEKHTNAFWRYSDNTMLFFKEEKQAREVYPIICKYLSNDYILKVNERKSSICHVRDQVFLGYKLIKDKKSNQVIIQKASHKRQKIYHNWYSSAIEKIGNEYHIIQDGVLSKQDTTILFENECGKRYLPAEVIDTINIYGNVIFTAELFLYFSTQKIKVNIIDRYGNLVGSFTPQAYHKSAKMMLKQVETYISNEKRLKIAKCIEIASLHNMRSNLRYYAKRKKDSRLLQSVQKITDSIVSVNQSKTIQKIMLEEARARETYYSCFDAIIGKASFLFEKRTRRPPQNPINAMVSFGNTLLYNLIAQDIHRTSMDIRIAFLHSTNNRQASLNLDIAEIFKPIIIDRIIFSLINRREINPNNHFRKINNNGIYLNDEGKRIYIFSFEYKLSQAINIHGKRMTYRSLIREETQKLQRSIMQDESYKPFKYTN